MEKDFKSYIADRNTSYKHIQEFIMRDYFLSNSIHAKFGISKDELIMDCWEKVWRESNPTRIDFITHRNAYSEKSINTYLDDRKIRQTTSVVVNWFLKKIFSLEEKKKIVRLKKRQRMTEVIEDMLKNSSGEYSKRTVSLISELNLTEKETVLFNWQIELISEEEAMVLLDVSRATLFNRWKKLKVKILESYYKFGTVE
jgi:hypothetical protein